MTQWTCSSPEKRGHEPALLGGGGASARSGALPWAGLWVGPWAGAGLCPWGGSWCGRGCVGGRASALGRVGQGHGGWGLCPWMCCSPPAPRLPGLSTGLWPCPTPFSSGCTTSYGSSSSGSTLEVSRALIFETRLMPLNPPPASNLLFLPPQAGGTRTCITRTASLPTPPACPRGRSTPLRGRHCGRCHQNAPGRKQKTYGTHLGVFCALKQRFTCLCIIFILCPSPDLRGCAFQGAGVGSNGVFLWM